MLSNKQTEELAPKIKVMQIILGGLFLGTLFPLIVFWIMRDDPKFTSEFGILPLIGAVMAGSCFFASFAMKMIQSKQAVKALAKDIPQKGESSDGLINKAMNLCQTNMIICSALIEGATFFNVLIFFLEGSVLSLGISILGLALIGIQFPFFNKVISSVEWLVESAKDESKLGL